MEKKFTFILVLLCCNMTFAKSTGSFNTAITFMSESRTLSCYVPTNYDSTQSYQLIVGLHGLGDNSTNYRNSLINTLKWQQIYPNAIIVCPDGGSDNNKDFYTPAGDEDIINQSIAFIKSNYNVDNNSVFLQGFSLGGRSALKFGLDNPGKFKGLLLNTPAIQGLLDLKNHPVAGIKYNYANAKDMSIFMSVGEIDYIYYSIAQELVKVLKQNNARIKFQSVPAMGHSIAVNSYIGKSVDFFGRVNGLKYDADLFIVKTDMRQCGNLLQADALVYNAGDSSIGSLRLDYSFGTDKDSKVWSGTLLPNNYISVPLSLNRTNGGVDDLNINISEVQGGKNDEDTANNLQASAIEEYKSSSPGRIDQGFETDKNGWDIMRSGSPFEWYVDGDVKQSGVSSMGTFNTILLFYSLGSRESFISPFVNISGLAQKSMTFDVAYNFHRYTPPYVTAQTDFADTLEVSVSTDCGATFSRIYRKGGKDLATAASPILNPLSVGACFFSPLANEWRTEILDLTAYSSVQNALFRFDYISGMGGSINIDNVSLGAYNLATNNVRSNPLRIFPNPANNELSIDLSDEGASVIHIYDAGGRLVQTAVAQGRELFSMDISHLNSGIYSVEVINGQTFNSKIAVVR